VETIRWCGRRGDGPEFRDIDLRPHGSGLRAHIRHPSLSHPDAMASISKRRLFFSHVWCASTVAMIIFRLCDGKRDATSQGKIGPSSRPLNLQNRETSIQIFPSRQAHEPLPARVHKIILAFLTIHLGVKCACRRLLGEVISLKQNHKSPRDCRIAQILRLSIPSYRSRPASLV